MKKTCGRQCNGTATFPREDIRLVIINYNIVGNNFNAMGTRSLENLPRLETFEIARESITSIETEAFKDLKLLANIDLR